MAEDDTVISSPSSEPSSTPQASESASTSSSPAEPPAGESGSDKETMLDAVLKVVPANTEPDLLADPAHPEAPTETKDGEAEAAPEDDDDAEPPAEAGNHLLRKKISKLLKSRREVTNERNALNEQLEQARPQAEIGAQLQSFSREYDLSADDIVKGLGVMAALRRGDWKAFYDAVAQPMRHAQEYLGHAIPADLREQISRGEMTEATAKNYARLRMEQQRTQVTQAAERQQYAQASLAQTQDQVNRSVNALEQQLAAKDPDYARKMELVRLAAIDGLRAKGGTINTVEEALEITRAAYDKANAMVRKMQPQLHATSRQPSGNGSTRSARAEPASLMEAALAGLEKSRNGAGLP